MKDKIVNWFTWYANAIAESVQYPWSDTTARVSVRRYTNALLETLQEHIDISRLTVEEAEILGFVPWSNDRGVIWLVPLYTLPIIPLGMKLTHIDGSIVTNDGKNIYEYNHNLKHGCIALGLRLSQAAPTLLEEAAEELENCYGRETELTAKIREYLNEID